MMGRVVAVGIALMVATSPAAADVSPWSRGVSEADQARAGALFKRGNAFMDEALWKEAAAEYRKALKLWKNPAIHGNLAICLLNLDQPIAGYEHMKQALRYGAAPFKPAVYRTLTSSRRLLRRQIVELEVRSMQAGTKVLVDGKQLLVGPGSTELILLPGPHRIEGYRPGHLTRNEMVNLLPGRRHSVPVELDSVASTTSYSRAWRPWKTWVVTGGAGVLLATATALLLQADADRRSYSKAIDAYCAPNGCVPGGGEGEVALPDVFTETRDRGDLLNTLGIVTASVGGAAAIAGAVMWWYNRPRKHVRTRYAKPLPVNIAVIPGRRGASILARTRF